MKLSARRGTLGHFELKFTEKSASLTDSPWASLSSTAANSPLSGQKLSRSLQEEQTLSLTLMQTSTSEAGASASMPFETEVMHSETEPIALEASSSLSLAPENSPVSLAERGSRMLRLIRRSRLPGTAQNTTQAAAASAKTAIPSVVPSSSAAAPAVSENARAHTS